jgi:hypothetical protein
MLVTSIGVRNFSNVPDDEVMRWSAATQKQIERDVRRFWDVPVPAFRLVSSDPDPGPIRDIDAWVYILNDVQDVTQRVGLGWHKFIDAWPLAYVLTDFTKHQKPSQTPSRVFSHEVIEMIIDPAMEMTTPPINNIEYLVEIGDVLSFDAAGYLIDGVMVSGFGTPAYFHRGSGTVFSFRGDDNADPVGGPLPAKAPEAMGTLLCWIQDGEMRSVLLDAALSEGAFPDPANSKSPPHGGTRRARRMLPAASIGQVALPATNSSTRAASQ